MGVLKFLGKVVSSAVTGTVGIAAEVVENFGAAAGCDPLANIAHSAKSASFNATRKIWGKEAKEYSHADGSSLRNKMEQAAERGERMMAERARRMQSSGVNSSTHAKNRRSDAELEKDRTGLNQSARSFQHRLNVRLPDAVEQADSSPGVYVLYLHGMVMKCGRAAYGQGVHWRLQQYYSLNYDNRARDKDYWSVSPENRDFIEVSWQCCPVSKCKELEYKLFKKYGKGPWGLRAPQNCSEDSWELLI